MKMYIGTYSDKAIINKLREDSKFKDYSDAEIKTDYIDSGRVNFGITHFFANDINDAKKIAKEMDLKNFSQVSKNIYEQGVNY